MSVLAPRIRYDNNMLQLSEIRTHCKNTLTDCQMRTWLSNAETAIKLIEPTTALERKTLDALAVERNMSQTQICPTCRKSTGAATGKYRINFIKSNSTLNMTSNTWTVNFQQRDTSSLNMHKVVALKKPRSHTLITISLQRNPQTYLQRQVCQLQITTGLQLQEQGRNEVPHKEKLSTLLNTQTKDERSWCHLVYCILRMFSFISRICIPTTTVWD